MMSNVDSCPRRGSASSNRPMVRKPSFRNGSEDSGTGSSNVGATAIVAPGRPGGPAVPVREHVTAATFLPLSGS